MDTRQQESMPFYHILHTHPLYIPPSVNGHRQARNGTLAAMLGMDACIIDKVLFCAFRSRQYTTISASPFPRYDEAQVRVVLRQTDSHALDACIDMPSLVAWA